MFQQSYSGATMGLNLQIKIGSPTGSLQVFRPHIHQIVIIKRSFLSMARETGKDLSNRLILSAVSGKAIPCLSKITFIIMQSQAINQLKRTQKFSVIDFFFHSLYSM